MSDLGEPPYRVVRNDEDQHSLWPAHLAVPAGWHDAGFTGAKADCLRHVQEVWPDITPKSARLPVIDPASR
ncbi:MAG: MbtH family protein [Proteobacteria bacterium]|nr:MbtH family protein [Pseudomonadota bacterium]